MHHIEELSIQAQDLITKISIHPKSDPTLYLSNNNLSVLPGNEVAVIFAAIPDSVTTLILSGNSLGKLQGGLPTALSAIPKSVTTLDLSNNDLQNAQKKTGPGIDGLVKSLMVIPDSIKILDLSNNSLDYFDVEELVKILKSIPIHIEHVSLKNNSLFSVLSAKKNNDKILDALGDGLRFDITENGESDLDRALLPMAQLLRSPSASVPTIPIETMMNVMFFLSGYKKEQHFKIQDRLQRLVDLRPAVQKQEESIDSRNQKENEEEEEKEDAESFLTNCVLF